MQFIYFIPGRTGAGKAELERLGISQAMGCSAESGPCDNLAGVPGAGTILWATQGPRPDVRDTVTLRWVPQFGKDSSREPVAGSRLKEETDAPTAKRQAVYYVGADPHCPPTPAELMRDEAIDGRQIELADGQFWTVPIARKYDAGGFATALPSRLCVDADGTDVFKVLPRYEACWNAAIAAWNLYIGTAARAAGDAPDELAELPQMSMGEALGLAATVLNVNYRVSLPELKILGALASDNVMRILRAAADIDGFETMLAASKKNSPGPPAVDS